MIEWTIKLAFRAQNYTQLIQVKVECLVEWLNEWSPLRPPQTNFRKDQHEIVGGESLDRLLSSQLYTYRADISSEGLTQSQVV